MTVKYICDYCGEEFDRPEECRVHEMQCGTTLKTELLIYTKALDWLDGCTFIGNNISFNNILIIKNTGYRAMNVLVEKLEKENYISPLEASIENAFDGFYYWSDFTQGWVFVEKWDNTLSRIVNTGTDIEDD